MSPEIFSRESTFDGYAVDVWGLGPMLFSMVTGSHPFEIPDPSLPADPSLPPYHKRNRFYYFSRGYLQHLVHMMDLGLSADLLDLLQRMFWLEPESRLSLNQVREHPWMQGEIVRPPPRQRIEV